MITVKRAYVAPRVYSHAAEAGRVQLELGVRPRKPLIGLVFVTPPELTLGAVSLAR